MTLKRLREAVNGYVVVSVQGKNPERLVNLCLQNGFPVWDFSIMRSEEGLVATFATSLTKYREIRPLARRARCVPKIIRRVGLPFLIGKVKRRPLLLWASVAFIAVMVYLAGSIWAIRVDGADRVEPGDVLSVARSAGLYEGRRRSGLDPKDVENAIQETIPDLSWVYVHYQGTLAIIEIVEKTTYQAEAKGDIVAAKDGVVESVLVLSGTPNVTPGQTVKAGDILILGIRPTQDPAGQGARGTVTAMTSYEARSEVLLNRMLPLRTGNKVDTTVIRYGAQEFRVLGRKNVFQWFEVEDYPLWRSGDGKVEAFTRVFYEIAWTETSLTAEEAVRLATSQAKETIGRRLPSSSKLIDLSCEALPTDGQTVCIRAVAVTIEDIGMIRAWPNDDTEVLK